MNIKEIPLIIPNFNQFTYTKNLVNWWKWYYPDNRVIIIDNGSCHQGVIDYCRENGAIIYKQNDFVANLNDYLSRSPHEYYCISDPDIMPHPATPPNFLEVFKHAIDEHRFHHAGFDLITEDIPSWNKKAGWIQGDEKALHNSKYAFEFNGNQYEGWKAPIDTTFALYKRENGGWSAPQPPAHWDNSIRMFGAFHLTWYLHPELMNEEMKHYFKTCLKRDDSLPSAGRNHFRPE